MSFREWFVKSCYDRKVIAYSRFRPMIATIWHVLFVVFIASIPALITFNVQSIQAVKQIEQTLQRELPPFTIKNGKLETEGGAFQEEHDEIGRIIIDPDMSREQIGNVPKGIALLKDKVVITDRGKTHAIPYTLLGMDELNEEDLLKKVKDLKGVLPIFLIILTIFTYLGVLGIAFLGITIVGALATLLRGKKKLSYRHLWVMTAHAFTSPVIALYWIDTLFASISLTLFLVATFIVLYFAIRTIPTPKKLTNES